MLLPCKPFLQELVHPSWLLQQRLCSFSHPVGLLGWTIARGSVSAALLAVGLGRAGVAGEELTALPFACVLQRARGQPSLLMGCTLSHAPLLLRLFQWAEGCACRPAAAAPPTCSPAPCPAVLAPTMLSGWLPECTFDSSQGVWAAPHFIVVQGPWQWAVKAPVPLFAALLRPVCLGGTVPVELPVSPGGDSPSRDAVPGQDARCRAPSPARLDCRDGRGAARDPDTLCWCRAEELALPRVLWQGPAVSICVTETVAQPPSAHSRDIFRPGCADEGEMTGSLRIRTTRCLCQPQLPGAMGGAAASGKAAQGHGVPGAGATTLPQERQCYPCAVAVGLLGAAAGAGYLHPAPSWLPQLHCS